jgi:hypothetical protein
VFISLAARSEGYPIQASLWDARYVSVPNGRLGLARFSVMTRSAKHGHHANGWTHKVLLPDVELLAVLLQTNSVCVCNL